MENCARCQMPISDNQGVTVRRRSGGEAVICSNCAAELRQKQKQPTQQTPDPSPASDSAKSAFPTSTPSTSPADSYRFQIPGFKQNILSARPGGLISSPKLLLNGQEPPQAKKRNHFLVQRDDGSDVIAELKTGFLDPVPKVVINDVTYSAVPPFKWYELLWIGLPLLLIIAGGALGGLWGGVAVWANAQIFRTRMSAIVQYLLTMVVLGGAIIAYFACALSVNMLINGS